MSSSFRISYWISDVCSSVLLGLIVGSQHVGRCGRVPAEAGEIVPLAAEVAGLNADDLGQAFARAVGIGQYGKFRALHVLEQDRLAPALLRRMGHGRQLVMRVDFALDLH